MFALLKKTLILGLKNKLYWGGRDSTEDTVQER